MVDGPCIDEFEKRDEKGFSCAVDQTQVINGGYIALIARSTCSIHEVLAIHPPSPSVENLNNHIK